MSAPDSLQTATLLVSCPDQKGIVATLAQTLYGHGANILHADQHTDPEAGVFFQRIRFDLSELRTDRTALQHAIGEVADRLDMTWQLRESATRPRVARRRSPSGGSRATQAFLNAFDQDDDMDLSDEINDFFGRVGTELDPFSG